MTEIAHPFTDAHLDRSRPIRFRIGAPIPVTGNGREAQKAVVAFIEGNLRAWGCAIKEKTEKEATE